MEDSDKRNLAKLIAIGAVAWVSYKVVKGLNEDRPIEKIVKEIVTEPVAAVVDTVEKVSETIIETAKDVTTPIIDTTKPSVKNKPAHLIKGSQEAKDYFAKLRAKKKENHKGHETKRGLAQDQKLISEEKHEVAYQKKKRKRKKYVKSGKFIGKYKKKEGEKILEKRVEVSKQLFPDKDPASLLNKEIDKVNEKMEEKTGEPKSETEKLADNPKDPDPSFKPDEAVVENWGKEDKPESGEISESRKINAVKEVKDCIIELGKEKAIQYYSDILKNNPDMNTGAKKLNEYKLHLAYTESKESNVEDKPYVRSTPEEIAQRNYRAYEDKEAIAKLNIKTAAEKQEKIRTTDFSDNRSIKSRLTYQELRKILKITETSKLPTVYKGTIFIEKDKEDANYNTNKGMIMSEDNVAAKITNETEVSGQIKDLLSATEKQDNIFVDIKREFLDSKDRVIITCKNGNKTTYGTQYLLQVCSEINESFSFYIGANDFPLIIRTPTTKYLLAGRMEET